MAQGKNRQVYSEQYFLDKGFVKQPDGSYAPPKFKNPLTHLTKDKIDYKRKSLELADLVQKEKIIETTNFEVKPVTEWFIPYQTPSKKNSRQNFTIKTGPKAGKQISIPSKRHKDYITATKKYWEVFGLEFNQTIRKLNLSWPVNIEMTFIRTTNQRLDFSALARLASIV